MDQQKSSVVEMVQEVFPPEMCVCTEYPSDQAGVSNDAVFITPFAPYEIVKLAVVHYCDDEGWRLEVSLCVRADVASPPQGMEVVSRVEHHIRKVLDLYFCPADIRDLLKGMEQTEGKQFFVWDVPVNRLSLLHDLFTEVVDMVK